MVANNIISNHHWAKQQKPKALCKVVHNHYRLLVSGWTTTRSSTGKGTKIISRCQYRYYRDQGLANYQ